MIAASVSLFDSLSRGLTVQKQLDRSMFCLGRKLLCTQGTLCYLGVLISHSEWKRKLGKMLGCSHVPGCFGMSYTVPIIKSNVRANSNTITVDDFRGISISHIISKVFGHCVLERYCDYLNTSDNQFGFKKGMSFGHAIYALRSAIDYYVYYGSTVNVCSLDLSKAFDTMNHHALFLKLMERKIPCNLLSVLEKWFAVGISCVKWGSSYSIFLGYYVVCVKVEFFLHFYLQFSSTA